MRLRRTYIFNQFGVHVCSVLNIKAHKWHFIVYKIIYVTEFAVINVLCTWLLWNLRCLHITNHVTDDNILMVYKGHAFFWSSKVNHCFMRSVGLFGLKLCAIYYNSIICVNLSYFGRKTNCDWWVFRSFSVQVVSLHKQHGDCYIIMMR